LGVVPRPEVVFFFSLTVPGVAARAEQVHPLNRRLCASPKLPCCVHRESIDLVPNIRSLAPGNAAEVEQLKIQSKSQISEQSKIETQLKFQITSQTSEQSKIVTQRRPINDWSRIYVYIYELIMHSFLYGGILRITRAFFDHGESDSFCD
jgi:hypothetical protein